MNIRNWPVWAKIGLPAVILIIVTVVALFATGVISPQSEPQDTEVVAEGQISVPDVVGTALEEAEKILSENDLICTIKDKVESEEPEGTVIMQSPDASEKAEKGSMVELTISEGKGTEVVADVKGKPVEEAKAILEDLGFVVKVEEKESKEVAPGSVVSQSVEGEKLEKGTEIIIVESTGSEEINTSETVKVPDLTGKTFEEAKKELSDIKLYYSKAEVNNASQPVNTVVSTSPAAGEEVKAGTTIKVTVNAGAKKLVIKDYSYKALSNAKAELGKLGFKVSVKYEENKNVSKNTVFAQKPAAGSSAEEGSTVVLTVSSGYTISVPDVKNMKLADAQVKLKENGLASKVLKYEESDKVAEGKVISQNIASGTKAEQGTVVGLVVSSGATQKETEKDTEASVVKLTGIIIKSQPSKTKYSVGDKFDKSGLAVTAKYSDGTTKDVTKQVTLSSPDMSKSGTKTVTVTYEDKTASFTITVEKAAEEVKLSSIAVTTKPSKTTYNVGDTLSTSGMVVTATYSDASTKKVTGYKCSPEKLTSAGAQTITVSYTDGSVEKTTTFKVTVNAKQNVTKGKVHFTVTPNKTTASAGDEITYTVTMETSEKLASIGFVTALPKGLTYVEGSGAINSNAKSKLGFDAIDWTEWSSRSGASSGENYVNGYASASKAPGSVVICTFKVTVDKNAGKGDYVIELTGLDEFSDLNWNVFDASQITVESTPVKVS